MILSVLWHMLPWWSWLVLVLAIAAVIFVPGLAPIVGALVARVPLAVWAFFAVVIGSYFLLEWHDAQLTKEVTEARDAYWKGREDKANHDYADALAAMTRKLEHAQENAQAAAKKHAAELAAADARHAAQVAQLQKERTENVTPNAVAACGDLHRGVIVHFNSGAARANGSDAVEDPAAAAARRATADDPSGVALDTYAAAVEGTQDALGDTRNQVIGWQKYHAEVLTPWIASTLEALSTCIPKGTTTP